MQEVVLSILIFIHQVGSCVGGWFDSGENPYEALRSYGGIATIELTVRDDQGLPVKDAEAKAFFDLPFNEVSLDVGKTDTQGRVTLSEEAIYNNGSVSISKDGYYNTDVRVKLVAPNQPFGFFGRRRWKTEILTVTLKKKRNPTALFVHENLCWEAVPFDEPLALDLQKGDWVAPNGKGTNADILVTVVGDDAQQERHSRRTAKAIILEAPGQGDGIQLCKADLWSDFRSTYQVDTLKDFEKRIELPRRPSGHVLDDDEYLVFRVRSEVDAEGKVRTSNYAKSLPCGLSIHGHELHWFGLYFNPTPNDTNLEFDLDRNLVPQDEWQRIRGLWP